MSLGFFIRLPAPVKFSPFDPYALVGDAMQNPCCPSCGFVFEKVPKREGKCAICGQPFFLHNGVVISEADRRGFMQKALNKCPAKDPCSRCGETQWDFESLSPNEKSAKWTCGYCGKRAIIQASTPGSPSPRDSRIKAPNERSGKVKSWVYFIEAIGLNKIKIGTSDDPETRLQQLATGSAVPLRIVGKIPGDVELEKRLHRQFEHLRFDKEWFHATKELLSFIAGSSVRLA